MCFSKLQALRQLEGKKGPSAAVPAGQKQIYNWLNYHLLPPVRCFEGYVWGQRIYGVKKKIKNSCLIVKVRAPDLSLTQFNPHMAGGKSLIQEGSCKFFMQTHIDRSFVALGDTIPLSCFFEVIPWIWLLHGHDRGHNTTKTAVISDCWCTIVCVIKRGSWL